MAVLINFKICDNAPECGGIEACKTHALFWDKKNKRIGIDNDKCTSCELCEGACPVGAIKVAVTKEEYNKIKKEIDEDPRKISDLFVDRYGAMPIDPDVSVKEDDFAKILSSAKPILVELFKNETINCLRKTIPIRELIPRQDVVFRKIELKKEDLINQYKIKKIPCFLFFKEGKLVGKIEGYCSRGQEKELKEKLKKLIKKA